MFQGLLTDHCSLEFKPSISKSIHQETLKLPAVQASIRIYPDPTSAPPVPHLSLAASPHSAITRAQETSSPQSAYQSLSCPARELQARYRSTARTRVLINAAFMRMPGTLRRAGIRLLPRLIETPLSGQISRCTSATSYEKIRVLRAGAGRPRN